MIPCICIDDSNRPNDIPLSKWVKKHDHYHITYIVVALPQNMLSYSLYEKPLDESCYPYEYFSASRFAIKEEDIDRFMELVKDCIEIKDINLEELMNNNNLTTIKK